jgi:hypothetical protein
MLDGTPWLHISCIYFWQKLPNLNAVHMWHTIQYFYENYILQKNMLFCRQLNLQPSLRQLASEENWKF